MHIIIYVIIVSSNPTSTRAASNPKSSVRTAGVNPVIPRPISVRTAGGTPINPKSNSIRITGGTPVNPKSLSVRIPAVGTGVVPENTEIRSVECSTTFSSKKIVQSLI